MKTNANLQAIIVKIQNSRKYRDLGIPTATIADVLQREMARHIKPTDALRSAKAILHNIMAPYLGDLDYPQAEILLNETLTKNDKEAIRNFCTNILAQHDSTRERLPYLKDFYRRILEIFPHPETILDLACGLNPFALPFMGLPDGIRYHAYDIHQPRTALINRLFEGLKMESLAETRDILVNPPDFQADAAFLFKEAHRMEKRRKGASRELISRLKTRVIFISLPNRSLDGQRDLRTRMDKLFLSIIEGSTGTTGWSEFPGETLYWIQRADG